MCGIAGLLTRGGAPAERALIERMTQALAHRGPDGEGVHVDGPIGLGHRRLAILDLTDAGRQPMASDDERCWITYNGELYNFAEIRRELETLGHRFRSRSDTEVILHAYQRWGRDCLARFNGMFAFGLWDRERRQLWLVRDRLGVKPLFYTQQPGWLAFASEIKGVLPALARPAAISDEALHHFLSLNYTPAPLTLFEGVQQLPPGCELVCDAEGTLRVRRYWDLAEAARARAATPEPLEPLLADAVRLRLVSDVEVGALVSGGLDSSAVVGWMRRQTRERIRTFTATFNDPYYNEAAAARITAEAFGTAHTEQPVDSVDLDALPRIVWHSEELTADSSMLALYRVAERARRDVKVVLTGDGADELFGGYPTYLATRLARWYGAIPRLVRERVVRPSVERLPVSTRKASVESKLRRFVSGDLETAADAHASWRAIFRESDKRRLLTHPGAWPPTARLYEPLLEEVRGRDLVDRLLYADLRFYLPNDMLVKVDRMTMAWGLEARTPYLDYRVVEQVTALSARERCAGGLRSKALLRRLTRGLVPEPIRRRAKAGFNVPQARWFQGRARPFLERHLLDAPAGWRAIIRRDEVERLLGEHARGRADHGHKLWGLLCLSLWWRQFLDGGS